MKFSNAAKIQVRCRCKLDNRSSSISHCCSTWRQMSFLEEWERNGNIALGFIAGKSSLHHVESIYGSVRNPLQRSYLGKAIPGKQAPNASILFHLTSHWKPSLLKWLFLIPQSQWGALPPSIIPFTFSVHDWPSLWCVSGFVSMKEII